tara:strand:+ start:8579 stop:8872 length:294 start_codon:yes stop_codon:yes gene_type:complete
MKEIDVKLVQMDLIFDVKLSIKKKIRTIQASAISIAKDELLTEIKIAKKELRKAVRKFKQGKIDKQELFDYEWYIYELKQELESLDGQQPESSEGKA